MSVSVATHPDGHGDARAALTSYESAPGVTGVVDVVGRHHAS